MFSMKFAHSFHRNCQGHSVFIVYSFTIWDVLNLLRPFADFRFDVAINLGSTDFVRRSTPPISLPFLNGLFSWLRAGFWLSMLCFPSLICSRFAKSVIFWSVAISEFVFFFPLLSSIEISFSRFSEFLSWFADFISNFAPSFSKFSISNFCKSSAGVHRLVEGWSSSEGFFEFSSSHSNKHQNFSGI